MIELDSLAGDPESIQGDDELDERTTEPIRLAGAGAALGSCFSVMIVVMALGSAASMSEPTGARAEIDSGRPSADSPKADPALDGGATPDTQSDVSVLHTAEQTAQLEALERKAMAAQTQVEAVQMRLSMLRTSLQQSALGKAEQSRQRVANAAVEAASYSWMSADDLADRTRRPALEQLRRDQATIRLLESQAQEEWQRRQAEVEAAEAEIAAWWEQWRAGLHDTSDHPHHIATGPRAASVPADLNTPNDRDLRPLIARHHARLTLEGDQPASTAASID